MRFVRRFSTIGALMVALAGVTGTGCSELAAAKPKTTWVVFVDGSRSDRD